VFLAAVLLKVKVFWDVTLCHWADSSRSFGSCIAFILRIRLSKKTGLFFPEDERNTYLRNVGNHSPSGTALHAGRLGSSSKNNIYNTEDHSPCRLSVNVTFPAGCEDFPVGTEQSEY